MDDSFEMKVRCASQQESEWLHKEREIVIYLKQ